jgi:Peptidase family M28
VREVPALPRSGSWIPRPTGPGTLGRTGAGGLVAAAFAGAALLVACGGPVQKTADAALAANEAAPPASQTGGFDGARAWGYLEKLVSFGPRPPDTPNIRREQQFLVHQLQSFGCQVSEDNFHAQTGVGRLAMENIVAKVPGRSPDIVLLLSHYDTLRLAGFVGADDGGSSTALLLEVAHDLCGRPSPLTVWIAFLDGEEDQTNFADQQQAQTTWSDNNSTFGSRELAAKLELSGQLKCVRAVILADMIGDRQLDLKRETNSTPWLTDLVWQTADRLGYRQYFLNDSIAVEDDHIPFLRRGVPAVDLIDFDYPYWHTTQDTLDKVSAKSVAIVGHVILETVAALEKKFS